MLTIAASLLAGIGLLFVGLRLLTENLKILSGRRLRENLAAWTRNPFAGLAWGGLFMAITQSAAAATFILIGMLRAGMVGVRQVLPILIGMNCSAGIILMVLIFDIRAAVLLLIGMSGLLYSRDRKGRAGAAAGAAFGIGLLFLGIHTTQTGIAPLADMPWFTATIAGTQGSYVLGFVASLALSFVAQSGLAVMIINLAFLEAGLFSIEQSVMIAYGAKIGSSALTYALSAKFEGESRQVAMFQVYFNIVGALILVPAFYAELYTDLPLMLAFGGVVTEDPAFQLAFINLMFNVVPGIVVFPLVPWVTLTLGRRYPQTAEEQLSKPKYLLEHGGDDPHSALRLIELEQLRLIDIIVHRFDAMGEGSKGSSMQPLDDGFRSLAEHVRGAIADLGQQGQLPSSVYGRMTALVNIQHGLETADAEVQSLAREVDVLKGSGLGERFSLVAIHGIGAISMTLKDVAGGRSEADANLLAAMTSEDGMVRVRKAYLAEDESMDATARLHLLAAASHCERIIWVFGELGDAYRRLGEL